MIALPNPQWGWGTLPRQLLAASVQCCLECRVREARFLGPGVPQPLREAHHAGTPELRVFSKQVLKRWDSGPVRFPEHRPCPFKTLGLENAGEGRGCSNA